MTPVLDEIDVVAQDHRRATHRDHIRRAINLVARENPDRLVHIADVRPLLPTWIDPHQPGAFICAQVRMGRLIPTGQYRPNGQTRSRNRTKPAQVYRLAAPIPEEEATVEREYVWQYMQRYNGRPFGSPRRMTTAEAKRGAARLPFLVVHNTETGDVIW